jgi:hypothetical protein
MLLIQINQINQTHQIQQILLMLHIHILITIHQHNIILE